MKFVCTLLTNSIFCGMIILLDFVREMALICTDESGGCPDSGCFPCRSNGHTGRIGSVVPDVTRVTTERTNRSE